MAKEQRLVLKSVALSPDADDEAWADPDVDPDDDEQDAEKRDLLGRWCCRRG